MTDCMATVAQRFAVVPRWIAFDLPIWSMFIAAVYVTDSHGKVALELIGNTRRSD